MQAWVAAVPGAGMRRLCRSQAGVLTSEWSHGILSAQQRLIADTKSILPYLHLCNGHVQWKGALALRARGHDKHAD